jgi:enoyl-CoA hydratase/carnithine racemase
MDQEKQLYLKRQDGGIAWIVWNNPPLNLTTLALMRRFEQLVMQVADDKSVRVVIIAAEGERAFCVGSDLKEFPGISDNFIEKKLRRENAIFSRLETMDKPVIASIGAHALGGGCEMALACDFRVIDERATIGQPEINLGTFPGSGGVFRLPQLVGMSKAMELLCLGTALNAQDAFACGLVNRVAPAGQADRIAYELALALSRKATFAIACIKRAVRAAMTQSSAEGIELSLRLSEEIFKTADSMEGVTAFLEKRKPRFEGAPESE